MKDLAPFLSGRSFEHRPDWIVARLADSGHLVTTQVLQCAATASTVWVRDGDVLVTYDPFAETKEQIGGFFMIEADDFKEALGIASRWPSACIGYIEVRPVEDELHLDRRYH